MAEREPKYINSISRAIHVLELYGRLNVQYLGVAEVSKELGIQKTTTFNILKTLAHEGWLVQDGENGKYRLSAKVLRVSTMVTRSISTDDLLLEEMHRIRDRYNEDVVLTAMIDEMPICVEKVQSSNMLHIQSKVGRKSDFFHGSTGKCLFAWQPEDFIESMMEKKFPDTPEGIKKRQEMREALAEIRAQGYCISIAEQDPGVASVAAPILDGKRTAIYSLAIIGEENRMRQKGLDGEIRTDIMNTAKKLSVDLSFLQE